MVSVIICSRDTALSVKVSESIAQTIGQPYEIININNSNGMYGICAAYNIGARRSKYNILCFMHEDVIFNTNNWGEIIIEILADKTIGLLGVTGSRYLVKAPAPWWGGGACFWRCNVLEQNADGTEHLSFNNPDAERLADVVAVDGLWFCTRKEVWEQYPFDEIVFPAFHGYDIDFSAQVFQSYRVAVTFSILVTHTSMGSFNKSWITSALNFSRKWKNKLPMTTMPIEKSVAKGIEAQAYKDFGSRLISIGYDSKITLRCLLKSWLHDPFSRDNLWLMKRHLKNIFATPRPNRVN